MFETVVICGHLKIVKLCTSFNIKLEIIYKFIYIQGYAPAHKRDG
jgi:hypothetical protein